MKSMTAVKVKTFCVVFSYKPFDTNLEYVTKDLQLKPNPSV